MLPRDDGLKGVRDKDMVLVARQWDQAVLNVLPPES